MKDMVMGKSDSAHVVTKYTRSGKMDFQLNEVRLNPQDF